MELQVGDIVGYGILIAGGGGLVGMVVMSAMMSGSYDQQSPVPKTQIARCRHPFAVCPCKARFFLEFRNMALAPENCPACQRPRAEFAIQEYTYEGAVWFPIVVEAQIATKCSKVKT